jgi:hypothetical protein
MNALFQEHKGQAFHATTEKQDDKWNDNDKVEE